MFKTLKNKHQKQILKREFGERPLPDGLLVNPSSSCIEEDDLFF